MVLRRSKNRKSGAPPPAAAPAEGTTSSPPHPVSDYMQPVSSGPYEEILDPQVRMPRHYVTGVAGVTSGGATRDSSSYVEPDEPYEEMEDVAPRYQNVLEHHASPTGRNGSASESISPGQHHSYVNSAFQAGASVRDYENTRERNGTAGQRMRTDNSSHDPADSSRSGGYEALRRE